MGIPPRVYAFGFFQNLSYFLAWSVIPVWAKFEGRATATQLGLLSFFGGITYILVALRAGPLSDRVPRTSLARTGLAGFALFCLVAWAVREPWLLVAASVLDGAAMALVWPPIQAQIGDSSDGTDLERNLGHFSLSWSAGKSLGFLLLIVAYGGEGGAGGLGIDALLACGALSLLLVPVLPRLAAGRAPGAAPLVDDDHHPPALRARHLRAAWCANFGAYAMGATVVMLHPDLLSAAGRPARDHGIVLGALYLTQTAGFWWFGRFAGWRYRFAPVASWMAAGAAALLAIGLGAPLPVAVPAAGVLGLALGQAYAASVYYSVHAEEDRGARAGIHEAVIGAANFSVPAAGGFLATRTGWTPAPYVLAAAVVAGSLVLAARAVRAPATSASA
jgi:MFS family permease